MRRSIGSSRGAPVLMRRLLPVLAVILVAAAAAYITAPAVLSKDRVKVAVAQELSARAGRPVTFSGEPTLILFPYIGFKLNKVVVANAPGLGDEPFAVIDSVTGSIQPLPLLLGRIQPGNIQVARPRIHLTVDARGRANWDVGGDLAEVPLNQQVATAVMRADDKASLGRLSIVDGFVTYENKQTGASSELSAVNMDIVWRSPREAAHASGTMVWRGETVDVTAALQRPAEFFSGQSSPLTLALRATPVRLSFQGSAFAAGQIALDGNVNLATPSLRQALAWVGRGVGNGSTLGAASIDAKAKMVGSAFSFTEATVSLDGNEAKGGLTIALGESRPRFQGTLAFQKLDVTPYLESFRATLAESSDWEPAPINVPVLRDADLDFRISAKEVAIGGARVGPAAASAVGTGGQIAVDIGDLQIYGGRLKATLTADLTTPIVTSTVRANIENMPARTTLANFAGVKAIDGTGSADIAISSSADSWNALLRSATGSASVKLMNCSIAGFDMRSMAADASDDGPANAATAFDSVSATLRLADGAFESTDILAEAPDFSVRVDGSASLLAPTIKGRGTLAMHKAGGQSGGFEIPFVIGGTWLQPLLSPDIDRLLLRKDTKPASLTTTPDTLPLLQ